MACSIARAYVNNLALSSCGAQPSQELFFVPLWETTSSTAALQPAWKLSSFSVDACFIDVFRSIVSQCLQDPALQRSSRPGRPTPSDALQYALLNTILGNACVWVSHTGMLRVGQELMMAALLINTAAVLLLPPTLACDLFGWLARPVCEGWGQRLQQLRGRWQWVRAVWLQAWQEAGGRHDSAPSS